VRCLEDPALVARLARERIPLTVCPRSNVKLRVVDRMADHPLRRMLEAGLVATVNSDDPAYFGGYLSQDLTEVFEALGLDGNAAVRLARNSLEAAFLEPAERRWMVEGLETYVAGFE
jgi:adenosine deaminase